MAEKKKPPTELLYTNWFKDVPRLEARSLTGADGRTTNVIGGIAAMFGAPSNPRLGFIEIVERSCFNKSQGDGYPLVRALFEHQPGIVLGAVHSGTMRIVQDARNMSYEVDMPETRSAEYESIKRGDVHSSSIAFAVYQDEWRRGSGSLPERHLISAQLDHIAPTSMPAYPDATVSLRSLAVEKEANIDEVVRDAMDGNLNRYFIRTDNIDKRENMSNTPDDPETRSTPLGEIVSAPNETHVHVHLERGSENPEPTPEVKPEPTPEVKVETPATPSPTPTPTPAPVPAPQAETPAPEAEPTPAPEPKEPDGYLPLLQARNRLREREFPKPPEAPKPPEVPEKS